MAKIIQIIEVNKETMIISYGIQYLCLNNFGDNHKVKFQHFKDEMLETRNLDLYKIFVLAKQYDVNIVSSRRHK